jgi:hypothetical protein
MLQFLKCLSENENSEGIRKPSFAMTAAIFAIAWALPATAGPMFGGTAHAMRLRPPPIARNNPCNSLLSCAQASVRLNHVLHFRFPIGTPEASLKAQLQAQGFRQPAPLLNKCLLHNRVKPDDGFVIGCPAWDRNWSPRNDLMYRWGGTLCSKQINVRWSSDKAGMITRLQGLYTSQCL